jgi:hypothetical protein
LSQTLGGLISPVCTLFVNGAESLSTPPVCVKPWPKLEISSLPFKMAWSSH